MVGGVIGVDLAPPVPRHLPDRLLVGEDTDWVNVEPKSPKMEEKAADGSYVKIDDGIIVSGICRGEPVPEIWKRLPWLHAVLDPGNEHRGQQLVRSLPGSSQSEGVVALLGFEGERRAPPGEDVASLVGIEGASLACFGGDLSDRNFLRKLAALAPGSTLSVVVGGKTVRCIPLGAPPRRIRGLADTFCANPTCISRSENGQRDVPPCFERAEGAKRRKLRREASAAEKSNALRVSEDWVFVCRYCERRHAYTEIWKHH